MHRADDLELRELCDALTDPGRDFVIDEHPGKPPDFQQVATLGQHPCEVFHLAATHLLEVPAMRQAQGSVTMPSNDIPEMPASQAPFTAPFSAVGEAALRTMAS